MTTPSATKKAAKTAVSPGLAGQKTLPGQLRALADQLERLGPLLNAATLKTEWNKLASAAARLSHLQPNDVLAPLEDYLACRHGWLEAANKGAESLAEFCKSALGAKSKALATQRGEDLEDRDLRLLGLCLNAAGREAVLAAIAAAQALVKPKEACPEALIQDHSARDALLQWGEMPLDEFLVLSSSVAVDLIKRSGALLGFKLSSKNPAGLKKLHKAAMQFHRNTRM